MFIHINKPIYKYWMLDFSRRASYEIALVSLFVRLSVHPSLSFLKIGSLVFFDIVHDASRPWSSGLRSQIFEKKIDSLNLGSTGLNQVQIEVFCHFLEFGSLIFLEIACNDSLQQCLTSSRDKTQIWGANLG